MVSANDIRAARARLHETQAEFAARFEVDQSTIANWEAKGPPQRGPAAIVIKQVLHNLPQTEAAQ